MRLLVRRCAGLRPGLSLCRPFSTLEDSLKAWEAKASKECKGADPYKAFSNTNHDVSSHSQLGRGCDLVPWMCLRLLAAASGAARPGAGAGAGKMLFRGGGRAGRRRPKRWAPSAAAAAAAAAQGVWQKPVYSAADVKDIPGYGEEVRSSVL